jgi:hypothetical protein
MGETCSTKREKRNVYRLWWENQRERDRWDDQDVSGWIILRWMFEK